MSNPYHWRNLHPGPRMTGPGFNPRFPDPNVITRPPATSTPKMSPSHLNQFFDRIPNPIIMRPRGRPPKIPDLNNQALQVGQNLKSHFSPTRN